MIGVLSRDPRLINVNVRLDLIITEDHFMNGEMGTANIRESSVANMCLPHAYRISILSIH